jgi:hypothetical protein
MLHKTDRIEVPDFDDLTKLLFMCIWVAISGRKFCIEQCRRVDNKGRTKPTIIAEVEAILKELIRYEAPERARAAAFWKTFEVARSEALRYLPDTDTGTGTDAKEDKDPFEGRLPPEIVMTAVFSVLVVHEAFEEKDLRRLGKWQITTLLKRIREDVELS